MSAVSDNLATLRAYPLNAPGSEAMENVAKLRDFLLPGFGGVVYANMFTTTVAAVGGASLTPAAATLANRVIS